MRPSRSSRGELARDLAEGLLRRAQLLGHELAGAALAEADAAASSTCARARLSASRCRCRAETVPASAVLKAHAGSSGARAARRALAGQRGERHARRTGHRIRDGNARREIALVEDERDGHVRRQALRAPRGTQSHPGSSAASMHEQHAIGARDLRLRATDAFASRPRRRLSRRPAVSST